MGTRKPINRLIRMKRRTKSAVTILTVVMISTVGAIGVTDTFGDDSLKFAITNVPAETKASSEKSTKKPCDAATWPYIPPSCLNDKEVRLIALGKQ